MYITAITIRRYIKSLNQLLDQYRRKLTRQISNACVISVEKRATQRQQWQQGTQTTHLQQSSPSVPVGQRNQTEGRQYKTVGSADNLDSVDNVDKTLHYRQQQTM